MGNKSDVNSESASRKTILLVEDEAIVAADEARRLTEEGYVVLRAASGEKAIEMVRAARPDGIDIVLMDIDLGKGMDGAQAAKEILKERNIPIVFLSSHTEKALVEKTETITSYGYVVKNSGITVLSASVKMAFKLHKTHQELMKQKAALHDMSETFRLFMESNPIYVFIKDEHIRPVYLSRNYEKMLGRPLSELLGKSMDDLFPSDLSKNMVADDQRILREGKPLENIIEVLEGRTYSTLKFPILIDAVPRYLAGYTIDVTDRNKAEEALRRSEERFRQVAENEGDFIWEVDANGLYTYANPVVERILGYRPDELVGKTHYYDLFAPDVREELKAGASAAFARKESFREFVNSNVRKDGALVILETSGSPILDEAGTLVGYRGADKDITERIRAEEALRDLVKQKEILMKELQHRVKNSLSVVSGLMGLGMEAVTDEQARGIFSETRSRIRSVASLYEQLYGTSDPANVELGYYFGQLAAALFKTYAPKTGNIRLKTRLDAVNLDTKRAVPLGLILNELVMNSLKYAYPAGTRGEIRVDLESSGDTVTFGVSDDGPGFPDRFDPKTSGSMGWSLIRMLTEEIDGELSCPARTKGAWVLIRFKP